MAGERVKESSGFPSAVDEATRHRVSRLQQMLAAQQLDALLISVEKDIQYLTGFVGHESLALVTGDAAIIVSDSRYDEYLEPWRGKCGCEVVLGIRHRLCNTVRELCEQRTIRRLGVQAEHIAVSGRADLVATVGEKRVTNTTGVVSSLRMRKDAQEIAALERAIDIAQQGLAAALERLEPGMTENQFSAVLEFEMKWRGASGTGFTPIIGSGRNSSIIHHSTGAAAIGNGVLLIDWGCIVDGYNSDLTRTFGISGLPSPLREVYDVVLAAQMTAIDAIRPGRAAAEIDAVARKVITQAGYGEYFGHGLGHGLGMDVHEGPYFNALSTDVILEPGLVMTVEPGVYIPGVGGVRIEDDIVVTEDGCRVLSNYPKDPDAALIEMRQTSGAHA